MPAPPPIEEGPPPARSELEEIQMRTNAVTDDSLDSTRRMMALCEESKEAGIRTLVALDDQGEQLDNIEKGMIQINEDMREAEKNLEGMEKCCGIFPKCFGNKSNKFEEDDKTWKGNEDGKVVSSQPQRVMENGQMVAYGGYIGKYTNDAREEEMENNMGQVATMVGNLRNMALDMGSEIENQNRQIDRVNAKASSNEVRIHVANERAGKLLKN